MNVDPIYMTISRVFIHEKSMTLPGRLCWHNKALWLGENYAEIITEWLRPRSGRQLFWII